jgi:ABC-2 type transport system ATP-binding protein
MDEAEHCDRLGLIYRGKLIALGSPQQLKERYAAGALLEVRAQPIMQALDLLASEPAAEEVAIFGATLHVVADSEAATEPIRRALEQGGVTVGSIETIVPSLEDVFVALIEQADEAATGGIL